MLRVRKPAGLSTIQLMVVTVIGFAGGVYIWKPLLQSYRKDQSAKLPDTTTKSD